MKSKVNEQISAYFALLCGLSSKPDRLRATIPDILLSRDTVLINFLTDLNDYDSYKITYSHNFAELNI